MGRDVNRFRLTRFVHNSKKFHLKKIQHFLRVALWFRPEARGRNPSPPAVLFSIYIVEVEIVIVIGMKKDDSKRKRGQDWSLFKKTFCTRASQLILKIVITFFKWASPGLFFVYFRSFQTNFTIFTTNTCEKMSIQYMMPGFKPTNFGI